jgi:hypothetical protein
VLCIDQIRLCRTRLCNIHAQNLRTTPRAWSPILLGFSLQDLRPYVVSCILGISCPIGTRCAPQLSRIFCCNLAATEVQRNLVRTHEWPGDSPSFPPGQKALLRHSTSHYKIALHLKPEAAARRAWCFMSVGVRQFCYWLKYGRSNRKEMKA